VARKARQLVLGALVAMLVACGGGATDGCSNLDPTHSTDLAICRAAVVTGTGTHTGTATKTVLDSQSYAATANMTISVAQACCPANLLLQTSPASANLYASSNPISWFHIQRCSHCNRCHECDGHLPCSGVRGRKHVNHRGQCGGKKYKYYADGIVKNRCLSAPKAGADIV
jgi:hypothetical protein